MVNKRKKAGINEVGEFEVKSGKLVVSDPCYSRGTWCAGILENVKNGRWYADVDLSNEGGWGMRVAELHVYAEGHENDHPDEPVKFEIGVDAGQVCIVDEAVYPHDETGEYGDEKTFYGRACIASESDVGADIIEEGRGVNSSSGYGDGSYAGYVGRTKDGKIVSARVVFIEEEPRCDRCDEYLDDDGFCPNCDEDNNDDNDDDDDEV